MAVVRCPACGDAVVWSTASPFRPFCSERCKNADLGAWASERYAISGDSDVDGEAGSARTRDAGHESDDER